MTKILKKVNYYAVYVILTVASWFIGDTTA